MTAIQAEAPAATAKVVKLRPKSAGHQARVERAFLPAALEVTASPPNPLGRMMAFTLSAVAIAALAWAWSGKVDIVAVATGKVVSPSRTQVVQPFETGSVDTILVRAGQAVMRGDPLIELNKSAAEAERQKAGTDLIAARLDEMRLEAFLAGKQNAPFEAVDGATDTLIQGARAQLLSQIAGRDSQIASLQQDKLQKVAERRVLRQTVDKIEGTLPMIAQRALIKTKAADIGNASIPAKLEAQQLLLETKAELDITVTKIESLDAAIGALEQKILATQAENRSAAMTELNKAQDRLRAARETLAKALRRIELLTLRAPIAGTVQQMHIAGPGAVVTPAQQLLAIVPEDERVEVEAALGNADIGFVTPGQRVEIKIDAFPFTRYGLIEGHVESVDRDAEATPPGNPNAQGSQRQADDTDHLEASERLRYTVRIALKQGTLDVDGQVAKLMPGMSVKAEIITGKRRIIDFVLAPLTEHAHDAFRER